MFAGRPKLLGRFFYMAEFNKDLVSTIRWATILPAALLGAVLAKLLVWLILKFSWDILPILGGHPKPASDGRLKTGQL